MNLEYPDFLEILKSCKHMINKYAMGAEPTGAYTFVHPKKLYGFSSTRECREEVEMFLLKYGFSITKNEHLVTYHFNKEDYQRVEIYRKLSA